MQNWRPRANPPQLAALSAYVETQGRPAVNLDPHRLVRSCSGADTSMSQTWSRTLTQDTVCVSTRHRAARAQAARETHGRSHARTCLVCPRALSLPGIASHEEADSTWRVFRSSCTALPVPGTGGGSLDAATPQPATASSANNLHQLLPPRTISPVILSIFSACSWSLGGITTREKMTSPSPQSLAPFHHVS